MPPFLLAAQLVATVARPHVTISLVPEFTAIVAGMPARLGVRLQVERGWHVYWSNPGEGGVATTTSWTLPDGFTIDSLAYPTPARLDVAGVVTHVHAGDVVLLTTLRPPARVSLPARNARITARVVYGVCKDICFPGEATVTLAWPVMTDAGPNAVWRVVDSLFELRQPRQNGLPWSVAFAGNTAVLSLTLPLGCAAGTVTFFPRDRDVTPGAVTARVTAGCGVTQVRVPMAARPTGGIRGVVVVGSELRGYSIGK